MNKYIVLALVAAGLLVSTGAMAADKLRGVYLGSISGAGIQEVPVYKIMDGTTACYVVSSLHGPAISCVK